jgi:hypothetical protein
MSGCSRISHRLPAACHLLLGRTRDPIDDDAARAAREHVAQCAEHDFGFGLQPPRRIDDDEAGTGEAAGGIGRASCRERVFVGV